MARATQRDRTVELVLDVGDLRALQAGDELAFAATHEGRPLRCALKLKGGRGRTVGELDHRLHVDAFVLGHLGQGASVTPLFPDVPFVLKLVHQRNPVHADAVLQRELEREPLDWKMRAGIAGMFALLALGLYALDRPLVALCVLGGGLWAAFGPQSLNR